MQGSSYHRRERKLLHLAGGAFAFCLPFIPYWLALAGGCGAVLLAYWLKPSFSPWLNSICKPEDRASGHIGGLRGYATTLLILLVGWRLLEPSDPAALRYAMFGWTALAFGDGLAGLVGPGPRVAPTVPWNRHKTWWGFVGSVLGIALAFAGCFLLPLPGVPLPATGPQLAILLLPLALAGAIVESLSLPLDDNYVVGLSCPVLAWVALQFV